MLPAEGVAQRAFLQYSVTQEASADHAAMTFLDASGQSARGLLEFFQILQGEELLSGNREDPYLRSHPMTAQRIEYVRNHVEHSRLSNVPDSAVNIELLKRIKVKLGAFTSPPSTTLAAYPEKDQSILARYARAIAYYRIPNLNNALPIIDGSGTCATPIFVNSRGRCCSRMGASPMRSSHTRKVRLPRAHRYYGSRSPDLHRSE